MEHIKEYLLSVTIAAIICSLITSLVGNKGAFSAVVRTLCGIFLALTALSPLIDLKLDDISSYFREFGLEADSAAAAGSVMADEASAAIIKSELEAYILDKASALGVSISVDVKLDNTGTPLPVSATLSGSVSPYAKKQLQEVIANELGIPEERQIWN